MSRKKFFENFLNKKLSELVTQTQDLKNRIIFLEKENFHLKEKKE